MTDMVSLLGFGLAGMGVGKRCRGHAPRSALGPCRLARQGGGLGIPSELKGECGGREPNLRGRLEASGWAKLPGPLPTINSGILPLLDGEIDI